MKTKMKTETPPAVPDWLDTPEELQTQYLLLVVDPPDRLWVQEIPTTRQEYIALKVRLAEMRQADKSAELLPSEPPTAAA